MRLFLLGATPSFDLARHVTAQERLAATGHNTGNQIIAHGLLKALDYNTVEWDYSKGAAYVEDNFDAIVIAAANFLFPGFDLGGMADFIAQTSLPVVMVGLGAQAQSTQSNDMEIAAGTLRLMQLVSERSHSIGVRGEFTARVLEQADIRNVEIVGCPSYYMAGGSGFALRSEDFSSDSPVAVHASRDVIGHSFSSGEMRTAVVRLYAEAARRKGVFVAQTELEEISISQGEDVLANAARLRAALHDLGAEPLPNGWLQQGMRAYWDVDAWIEDMRHYPFVVGTRFHGTMAALHAGTPAVCVTHDSRTSEMCDFLNIPSVDIVRFNEKTLEEVRREMDVEALGLRYNYLYPRYLNFLRANGMTVSTG